MYTPGPWRNVMCHIRTVANDESFPNGRKLATVHIGPVGSDEAIANGNLIAAAPDLLTACQDILEGLELRGLLDGWAHDPEIVDRLRAAIARAEGKEA